LSSSILQVMLNRRRSLHLGHRAEELETSIMEEYSNIPHPPKTIIGKARISEIKHYKTTDEFTKDYPRHHCKSWKYDYGLILDKVKKVEPHIEYILGKRFFLVLPAMVFCTSNAS
jgi:hypothetical protein